MWDCVRVREEVGGVGLVEERCDEVRRGRRGGRGGGWRGGEGHRGGAGGHDGGRSAAAEGGEVPGWRIRVYGRIDVEAGLKSFGQRKSEGGAAPRREGWGRMKIGESGTAWKSLQIRCFG